MKIENIRIQNFKSLYGDHYFDFTELGGLIKLSGVIGAGKTSIGEAMLWGLFGTVKGQNNGNLISWNTKACEVEINLESKGHKINILRNIREPLKITVDGKMLIASNKRDTQQILEEEYFDTPKLAILKMCIISFNAFNSLASMSAGETKQFLDDVFGFKTFTSYNDQVVIERKEQMTRQTELNAIYNETENQIKYFIAKKDAQQQELRNSVDIDGLEEKRNELIEHGKKIKEQLISLQTDQKQAHDNIYSKMLEAATLGKQAKEFYNTFKSGKCPTCGNDISTDELEQHKNKMYEYAETYKKHNAELIESDNTYNKKISELNTEIQNLKTEINNIDTKFKIYENNKKLINENYDELITDYQSKLVIIKKDIDNGDLEIGEWNEMNDLFTKTLRYKLLETLIPHINKSIQYYMNKLEQNYKVEFDQEFKPHIYIDNFYKEISYNNLSTGQKKTLDMAIIFGVLQNIIANVDFNIFFLDELFSNLDSDSRNIMLSLLKESLAKDRTIFVINHAEMNDDYFDHKLKVKLVNKKIAYKKTEVVIRSSSYTKVF